MAKLTFDDLKQLIPSVYIKFDDLLDTDGENAKNFASEEIKKSDEQWKKVALLSKLFQMLDEYYPLYI